MINEREIFRYLGYGRNIPDNGVKELIKECSNEVKAAVEPKCIYRRFEVHISEDIIYTAGMRIKSNSLSRNLRGCSEAVLMAATLGTGADRLLIRYQKFDMAKAAVIQAVSAAMIEDYCDTIQESIKDKVSGEGLYVRPRFSPGYGDWSLADQPLFLSVIDAGKTTGITLSDGGIMLPEKSVTAIMGLSRINTLCNIKGCEQCQAEECEYRR